MREEASKGDRSAALDVARLENAVEYKLAVFASLHVAYENPFVSREDKERCSFMLSKQNPIRSGSMATAPKGSSSWILWICFYSFLWCPLQPRQQPLRLPEHFWKLSLSKTQAAWLP